MTPLWPLVPRGRGLDAVWRTNGANGKPYAIIEAKAYADPNATLGALLLDTLDKQEYAMYRQQLSEWRNSSRRKKRSLNWSKEIDDRNSAAKKAEAKAKPVKPESRVMQMSHEWIQPRIKGLEEEDRASLSQRRGGHYAYSRHVLLFSAPEIFEHTIAVLKWMRHSLGRAPAPLDAEHGSHRLSRIFGDAELDNEEKRRREKKSSKAVNTK